MARVSLLMAFTAITVLFHVVYILSIFDIYFVSPIVSGMREFRVEASEPPAQRLVLFVGDGLRADKAFQYFPDPSPPENTAPEDAARPRPLAPFIRSRVLEHGTFGVSHTRVPTESRPGHVALIAGLYEDVSSVTTGWKLNPVNFDSVFNRSRHTWSWGSPDILPMFAQGAVPGRVDTDMYGAEAEDFTSDAVQLDLWVFDKVKGLFQEAKTNATLDAELRKAQNVFFLHLLGLDTTGHYYRPYSKEYLHNIKVVDQGVKEITELIEDFYGDGKTAFVFTADHGMSDWGSHGDGHPDNTRTPLVAWGSGVAPPVKSEEGTIARGHEDGFSSDWNLDYIQRNDVAQADIAALMAYLVGLAFPVNSVGELPLAYLDADSEKKAEAVLVNAKEILEMYRIKELQKKNTVLRYKPFPGFANEEHSAERRITAIRELIDDGKHEEAIAESTSLIKLALEGLRYLQTYDWLFLRTLVTLGYLGFIAFAWTTVIRYHVLHGETETSRTVNSMMAFSSVLVVLFAMLYIQHSAITYYAYAAFPVFFWEEVYANWDALVKGRKVLFGEMYSAQAIGGVVLKSLAFLAVLEALVQSYFHRELYSICYILALFWPAFYGKDFILQNKILLSTWSVACASMSGFTLLSANKVENLSLIMIAGVLMLAVGLLYLLFEKSILADSHVVDDELASPSADHLSRAIIGAQLGLIALAMIVTRSSVTSLQAKQGLPLGTQVVGWLTLLASLIVPFLHGLSPNNHYIHRLMVIFLAFAPSFIILTISYEGLFYLVFFATVFTWVRLEHHIYAYTTAKGQADGDRTGPSPTAVTVSPSSVNPLPPALGAAARRLDALGKGDYRSLTLADARISLFFFFLLQSAFFSTGNIASVSSFSLEAVARLIPVFDPFSQGALLMFKILVPFAVISANLGILNRRLRVAPSALFMMVMALGDVLTLSFFWMVRDEGSWLDIGTSISHFCIASGLSVFVAGLEGVSGLLVRGVGFEDGRKKVPGSTDGNAVEASERVNGTSGED